MKKNSNNKDAELLRFTVAFEEPLAKVFLEECQREDRDMVNMVRVIMKRYFFGRIPGSAHQEPKSGSPQIPHLGDRDLEPGSQEERTG